MDNAWDAKATEVLVTVLNILTDAPIIAQDYCRRATLYDQYTGPEQRKEDLKSERQLAMDGLRKHLQDYKSISEGGRRTLLPSAEIRDRWEQNRALLSVDIHRGCEDFF